MWPWGHAVVGLLCLGALVYVRRGGFPSRAETVVVLFATQLPDLVDKPLAWWVEVLPAGRSLAHSVFTATLLVCIVVFLATRRDRPELGGAFAVGYFSHLPGDLTLVGLGGRFEHAAYLFWPLLESPDYGSDPSVIAHFASIEPTPMFLVQTLAAFFVALLLGIRAFRGWQPH